MGETVDPIRSSARFAAWTGNGLLNTVEDGFASQPVGRSFRNANQQTLVGWPISLGRAPRLS